MATNPLDWDALQASDLADEVKSTWNLTKRSLDEQASEVLGHVCAVADGRPLPPDAVNRAAQLVATIRATPWLV